MLHICLALFWIFPWKRSYNPQLTPFFLISFPLICVIVIQVPWSTTKHKNHLGVFEFKLLDYWSECGNTCTRSYHYKWLTFIKDHSAFFQPSWYEFSILQLTKPPRTNTSNLAIEFSFELCDCHCQVNGLLWLIARNAVLSNTLPPNTLNEITQRNLLNLKVFHYFKNVTVLSLAIAKILTFAVSCFTSEMFQLIFKKLLGTKLRKYFTAKSWWRLRNIEPKFKQLNARYWLIRERYQTSLWYLTYLTKVWLD